jgi:alpha-D-xyloside xylohydrolase
LRRTTPIAVLLLALSACHRGPAAVRIGDDRYHVEVSGDARTLTLLRGEEALLAFPADAFQLGLVPSLDPDRSYDPYWLEYAGPISVDPIKGLQFVAPSSAELALAGATELRLELRYPGGATASVTVSWKAKGRFEAHFIPGSPATKVAFLRLDARARAGQGYYGLGEWPDTPNHAGQLRPMQMEPDFLLESADDENHVPVPLVIGTTGFGLFAQSMRPGAFDVARKTPDLLEVTFGTSTDSAQGLTFHLFAAEHPLDVTRRYYDVTGDPLLPAPWGLGPWIWRDENRDEAEVLDDIRKIRDLDLATSGLWIDRPYSTAVNTFDFAAAQFPDPAAILQAAHDAGLRFALWHVPYLEKAAQPYRDEFDAAGFFTPRYGLLVNGWSVPVDFTNPAAYARWDALVSRYTDMGVEGFKLDYAEDVIVGLAGLRTKWEFADGSDERTMHYRYQLLYHRLYAGRLPREGGYLLCRAGRWGDQKNVSVIWPGDMDATLTRHREVFVNRKGDTITGVGGLPATVQEALSLGPSGFPFFAADTGGYRHSPPDKETFVRWFEQTALSVVMNVGDSSSEPPWVFTAENGRDQEALDLYRVYARLHLRLFPYLWTYAEALKADGRPILRDRGLAFPELAVPPPGDGSYLVGDHLFVAPVMTQGATTRPVSFPPGEWIDWWDGSRHPGRSAETVDAPLAKLPLYLRAGGIVPLLRPTIDTLAPTATPQTIESYANDPGRLHAVIGAGGSGTFTLFDGTVLSASDTELRVEPAGLWRAGAQLERIGGARPASVAIDGTDVAESGSLDLVTSGWQYAADRGGTLVVKLPGGSHRVALH